MAEASAAGRLPAEGVETAARDRFVEYDKEKRTVRLLPPGVTAAETLVAAET
jgi:hypothetical protein